MPITTYISDLKQEKLHNDEITYVLSEVGDKYVVKEFEIEKGIFKKVKSYCYEMLYKLDEAEAQVINFYSSKKNSSGINTFVEADIIVAYLYGVLSGRKD